MEIWQFLSAANILLFHTEWMNEIIDYGKEG